ncbi:MAG: single-stranded DNA-binding protein [Verrucomicrobiales bacterium]|nr:single-stranded DNA-binding protein [Verrucomicrobiales bacterium]
MKPIEAAQEILDTMLGYLGFVVRVEIDEQGGLEGLQVLTEEPKPLIGHRGERLDDLQYLLTRIVQARLPAAPRIRVDVDHYRSAAEHRFLEEADQVAAAVITSGQSQTLAPMNSYPRRTVHNHFANHPKILTWSPPDSARVKCITLMLRKPGGEAGGA